LLNILLKAEGELPDNSRLAGSFFIRGAWLLLEELAGKEAKRRSSMLSR
jgi:hypothetical protein